MSPERQAEKGRAETKGQLDASRNEETRRRNGKRTSGDLPSESFESSFLHRISNDLTILEENESVGRSEGEGGSSGVGRDGDEFLEVVRAVHWSKTDREYQHLRCACEESMLEASLDSSNSLDNEILSGDGSSLVEAADVDTTGERDPEGFGTEDGYRKQRWKEG